jgi:hypothetical protein
MTLLEYFIHSLQLLDFDSLGTVLGTSYHYFSNNHLQQLSTFFLTVQWLKCYCKLVMDSWAEISEWLDSSHLDPPGPHLEPPERN